MRVDEGTYGEDVFELGDVVDALSVELELELVGDLFHAVSPVGHGELVISEFSVRASVLNSPCENLIILD